MAVRKARKRRSNPLQISIRKVSLPEGVTAPEYIAKLRKALRTKELPDGWEVDIAWRNPNTKKGRTKDWQQGSWGEVLQASRSGFATVVAKTLDTARERLTGQRPATVQRISAGKKAAQTRKVQKERMEALAKAKKRSDAAKKGARTKAMRKRKLI